MQRVSANVSLEYFVDYIRLSNVKLKHGWADHRPGIGSKTALD